MDDPTSRDRELDNRLADFTDRVLQGMDTDSQMMTNDAEIAELEDTILRLKRAVQASVPDPATDKRIRARLAKEWETSKEELVRPSWSWQRLVFAAALCVVVIALGAFLITNPGGDQLTGAAGSEVSLPGVFGFIVVLAIIFLFWLEHRKK